MLTYDLSGDKGPLYKTIYEKIKEDILAGKLLPNSKMPSKRTFAANLGVSTITIENAYELLISEGFISTEPKKGYFVSNLILRSPSSVREKASEKKSAQISAVSQDDEEIYFDFSANQNKEENFPFSVWAKLMRETMSLREKELMRISECGGVYELRKAIADHLESFRGMSVDPEQIIVGAGTEYLYSLLIKLLGNDKRYCIENPGYRKIKQIYESNSAVCVCGNLDEKGIVVENLRKQNAHIAHISPTHHFPTGILMPVSRRYELLAWANENAERYIIEDDYDSEFRLNGKPVSPMYNLDTGEKVIYMNTFSKSLASTIRISYMVLPGHLVQQFYRKLGFYSCTVSTFEQYTLAAFISQGYFEKHINRMRLHYGRTRKSVLDIIKKCFTEEECKVIENDSGLHFLLKLKTDKNDRDMIIDLLKKKIRISAITDYYMEDTEKDLHQFILNYSSIDTERLENALMIIKENM